MMTATEIEQACYGISPKARVDILTQWQISVMREGMRRAAELIHPKGKPYPNNAVYINTVADAKEEILSAAESLTEKDL